MLRALEDDLKKRMPLFAVDVDNFPKCAMTMTASSKFPAILEKNENQHTYKVTNGLDL